jgi:hypothetical protein
VRGDAFARGGAVGKVTQSLWAPLPFRVGRGFKRSFWVWGVPFSCVAACCLHALGHLRRGPVPPGVSVHLCVCAGIRGFVCRASSLLATPGYPNLREFACMCWKSFGMGGKVTSLLSRHSEAAGLPRPWLAPGVLLPTRQSFLASAPH